MQLHVNDVPKIDQIAAEDSRTVTFTCNYSCPSLGTVTFADLPILPSGRGAIHCARLHCARLVDAEHGEPIVYVDRASTRGVILVLLLAGRR